MTNESTLKEMYRAQEHRVNAARKCEQLVVDAIENGGHGFQWVQEAGQHEAEARRLTNAIESLEAEIARLDR